MNHDVDTVDGRTTLWINSTDVDAGVKYYRARGIDYLGINPVRGYALKDIEFLKSYPDITGLIVVSPATFQYGWAPLSSLRDLRALILPEAVGLSLRDFPRLEEFIGVWHPQLDMSGCKALKHLRIRGYKAKSGDLAGIPELPSLGDLGVVQSSLTSLHGIARFQRLARLELSHLSKLSALAGVEELGNLERLDCESCRHLQGYDVLRMLKHLRVLRLFDCGTIPSLSFVRHMKGLEEFLFVKTTISDGDLTPLLHLKVVEFLAKKGYSHTPEQLDAALQPRGGNSPSR